MTKSTGAWRVSAASAGVISAYIPLFIRGERVRVELRHDLSGVTELLWVVVDDCDDEREFVFGRLDIIPVINSGLKFGQQLAVRFANVRESSRWRQMPKSIQ